MKTKTLKKSPKASYEIMGQKDFYDVDTGDKITMQVVKAVENRDIGWYKVWLADMVGILKIIGGAKFTVFNYIIDNMYSENNFFAGTVRDVAEKTKISEKTVNQTINLLINCNFMKKKQVGLYQINPDVMAYGSSRKRGFLCIEYNSNPSETPLDKAIKESKLKNEVKIEQHSK